MSGVKLNANYIFGNVFTRAGNASQPNTAEEKDGTNCFYLLCFIIIEQQQYIQNKCFKIGIHLAKTMDLHGNSVAKKQKIKTGVHLQQVDKYVPKYK